MRKLKLWVVAATIVCGTCVLTSCSNKHETSVSATDDSSQFVTLTDAVPDAILEIRYF